MLLILRKKLCFTWLNFNNSNYVPNYRNLRYFQTDFYPMWILICNGRLVASGLLCFCCISVVIYMLCKKYIILCYIIYKVVTSLLCFFWLQSPNDAIIQLRFVFAWEIPKITPWSNLFSTGNYLLKTMSEEHVMDLELAQSIKFRKKSVVCIEVKHLFRCFFKQQNY